MSESIEPQHSEASPQHTPGPWHRSEAQPDAIVGPRCTKPCRICDVRFMVGEIVYATNAGHFGGHFVCESVGDTPDFDLITAAPDLLVALKSIAAWVAVFAPAGLATGRKVLFEARDAIAKAEGRQS